MTDIFFSYSSKDRERVRPAYDLLTSYGFDVFWDQDTPANTDWDTWIKEHLAKSRSAIVFWSANSLSSNNVRHETTIAYNTGKLIQVLLEPVTVAQFPMGLYNQQAINLQNWSILPDDPEWQKLLIEVEAKVAPWIGRRIAAVEFEAKRQLRLRRAAEAVTEGLQSQFNMKMSNDERLQSLMQFFEAKLNEVKSSLYEEFKEYHNSTALSVENINDEIAALKMLEKRISLLEENSIELQKKIIIKNKGKWYDTRLTEEPAHFRHLYILLQQEDSDYPALAPGVVVRGKDWNSHISTWDVIHGRIGVNSNYKEGININNSHLSYLGPKWKDIYAKISDEFFKDFAKPRILESIEKSFSTLVKYKGSS